MKTLFYVLVASLAFSTYANAAAFPLADSLQKQTVWRVLPQLKNPPARAAAICTDFSGTWKGVCTYSGQKQDSTVVIKQNGCSSIESDGTTSLIGGLGTASESAVTDDGHPFAAAFTTSVDWNADQTALEVHADGVVKKLGASGRYPINGAGAMHLDGGKLGFDFAILGASISCVYDKQ